MRLIAAGAALVVLAACSSGSSDPGPLAGTWQLQDAGGMTLTFRRGETEALGLIEKASYKVEGSDVLVTSENGPMKGLAARYTIVSPGVARSAAGTMRRVR